MNIMKRILVLTLALALSSCRHMHDPLHAFSHTVAPPNAPSSFPTVPLVCFLLTSLLLLLLSSTTSQYRTSVNLRRHLTSLSLCQEVNPYSSLPPNQLLWLTGTTTSSEPIRDDVSGVRIGDAIRLIRTVEVRENTKKKPMCASKDGGDVLQWNREEDMVDPDNWWIRSAEYLGNRVRVAAYELNQQQKRVCQKRETILPVRENAQTIVQKMRVLNRMWRVIGQYIYFSKTNDFEEEGALRIKYERCPVGPISLICQKSAKSNTFQPFDIGEYIQQRDGRSPVKKESFCFKNPLSTSLINAVQQSTKTKQEMLKKLYKQDCCFDCGIRLVSYMVFVLVAFWLVHSLTKYYGHIPIIGGLLTNPTVPWQLFATVILTFPIYLLIISIPWLINYRSVGVGLFSSAILFSLGILLIFLIKPHSPGESTPATHHHYFG